MQLPLPLGHQSGQLQHESSQRLNGYERSGGAGKYSIDRKKLGDLAFPVYEPPGSEVNHSSRLLKLEYYFFRISSSILRSTRFGLDFPSSGTFNALENLLWIVPPVK